EERGPGGGPGEARARERVREERLRERVLGARARLEHLTEIGDAALGRLRAREQREVLLELLDLLRGVPRVEGPPRGLVAQADVREQLVDRLAGAVRRRRRGRRGTARGRRDRDGGRGGIRRGRRSGGGAGELAERDREEEPRTGSAGAVRGAPRERPRAPAPT